MAVFSLTCAISALVRDSSRSFDCQLSWAAAWRRSASAIRSGARLDTSGSLAWLVARRVSSACSSRGLGGVAQPAAAPRAAAAGDGDER